MLSARAGSDCLFYRLSLPLIYEGDFDRRMGRFPPPWLGRGGGQGEGRSARTAHPEALSWCSWGRMAMRPYEIGACVCDQTSEVSETSEVFLIGPLTTVRTLRYVAPGQHKVIGCQ